MPSYQPWGPSAQHSRLPPTPPEYQNTFLTPMSAASDAGFYQPRGFHARQTSSRDHSDRYHQVPAYSGQHSLSSHAHPRMSHATSTQDFYPTQLMPQYQYGSSAIPVLPPIRVSEALDHFGYPQQEKKEEKPTGGVAQHLDYEMNLMASFVAEMSQKLVSPSTTPTSPFRKYVSQILSSTRLPSSTIMLGLFYLATRMRLISERGQESPSSSNVYRMLTTCLLLGSKFLDDNTFQNRSWAEVSSIPVKDLNLMELEWLQGFNWEIHSLMYTEEEGFFSWIEHWHNYECKAKLAKVKELQKLSPIETNFHHNHIIQHQPLMSPDNPIPPQYQQGPQFDTQWVRPFISDFSPPSAPHSGPATPEYYGGTWSYNPAYTRQSWKTGPTAYSHQPSYRHNQSFTNYGYGQPWAGHGHNCGCTLCATHPEFYFNQSGYNMQTVVG